MALRSLLFVSLLIVSLAAPLADAKLIGKLLGVIRIQGTVYCSANGNIGVNGTATPPFANAVVQLQCGIGFVTASARKGKVRGSAITSALGIFSILLDPVQFLVSALLNNCNLVVTTSLSTCNSSLPVGGVLSSPLRLVGRSVTGLLSIINLVPAGFRLQK